MLFLDGTVFLREPVTLCVAFYALGPIWQQYPGSTVHRLRVPGVVPVRALSASCLDLGYLKCTKVQKLQARRPKPPTTPKVSEGASTKLYSRPLPSP